MNRRFLVVWIGALVAGMLAFAVAHKLVCRRHEMDRRGARFEVATLARLLNLDADQVAALSGLHADWKAGIQHHCARSCRTRHKLAAAIGDPAADDAYIDLLIQEMCLAYEALERASLAHIRAVRDLLREAQVTIFDDLLLRCLCDSCNSGCRVALEGMDNNQTQGGSRHEYTEP